MRARQKHGTLGLLALLEFYFKCQNNQCLNKCQGVGADNWVVMEEQSIDEPEQHASAEKCKHANRNVFGGLGFPDLE